ncbi:MAG: sulfotransferase [Planctomycetota bacterium]
MSGPPFFIVGASRSGTTMLRLMLNAHPRLCIPPESHFLIDLHKQFGEAPFDAVAATSALRDHHRFREWALDDDAWVTEPAPTSWSELFSRAFAAFAHREDKPRWGDKTPIYARWLARLHDLFPDAQVVHIIRDPRDVVSSLLSMPWFEGSAYDAAEHWRAHVAGAHDDGTHLFGDRYLEVRYEDLVHDPPSIAERICRHLGEPMAPEVLHFQESAGDAIPEHRKAWHQRTAKPIDPSAIGRWRKELARKDVALTEHVTRSLMHRHGYEPETGVNAMAAARTLLARARRVLGGS